MKITRYQDIPKFPSIHYSIDVPLGHLKEHLQNLEDASVGDGLQLCPDFQRGHVWTREQQTAYMEFIFRGGTSGRDIYMNHPGWMESWKGDFVLVDGLQRVTAALSFLRDSLTPTIKPPLHGMRLATLFFPSLKSRLWTATTNCSNAPLSLAWTK